MIDKKVEKSTPAELYRIMRPEYFSDTEIIREIFLPREVLSLELENITTNQKENEFETLCRRLSEKFITPNLIPQVGPTGGGDGKTDSDTYPISTFISDRWFTPEAGWEKDEKWAFAFSAKKKWKDKVKSDVEKVVLTKRGYTKIFYITNQMISSKKKKETQDDLKKDFDIEVTILDGEWIIEKIYNNDLIDLAVDCLNLTQTYKNEKRIIGKNDSQRINRLKELENNINNPKRYFEYDYQIVEDALEAAIISRMLERPRDEVEGKFDRALRFCKKVNFDKQWIRLHYQRAWTYLHWYNDYSLFIDEYRKFKVYTLKSTDISDVDLFFNLYNLLIGISSTINLEDYQINIKEEKHELIKLLDIFENNVERPCSSLISKTQKVMIELFECIKNKSDPSLLLKELTYIIDKSQGLLEYPFESYKEIIEKLLGSLFTNEIEFDNLIDKIAFISEIRNSQKSAGEVFFNRGVQKLESENYKDSVIYFGKAVVKLAKEESQKWMFLSLIGLGHAYRNLGLIWASNNCFISAAFISLKSWFASLKLTTRAIKCIKQLAEQELFIGRIPVFFAWYEMYSILSKQVDIQNSETDISIDALWDGCLGTRLLNTDFNEVSKQTFLPDVLDKLGLWMSRKSLLYLLGYTDILTTENKKEGLFKDKNFEEFFINWANQPFKNQIIYRTDFLYGEKIKLSSKILGCEIVILTKRSVEFILAAETLLSFLEGFLATCLEGVYPTTETLIINILKNEKDNSFLFKKDENNIYNLFIKDFKLKDNAHEIIWQFLMEFTITILVNHFYIDKPLEYIKGLFEKEELHERLSLILNHRDFTINILGENPKFFIENWISKLGVAEYPLIRIKAPHLKRNNLEEEEDYYKSKLKLSTLGHNKRTVISLIDDNLWNKAEYIGFGFFIAFNYDLGLTLCFKDGNAGKSIFKNWIQRVGNDDRDELIRISIIKGVNKNYPHWYRVHITANISKMDLQETSFFQVTSRTHEMNANNSENLDRIIGTYNIKKNYKLFPAQIIDGKIEPFFDLFISKRELNIVNAWEIDEHDLESTAIKKNDEPFIPDNVTDAPVNKVLNRKCL